MQLTLPSLYLSLLLVSTGLLAESKQHAIGVGSGFGGLDGSEYAIEGDLTDSIVGSWYLDYSYRLAPNLLLQTRYTNFDSEDFSLLIDEFADATFEGNSLSVAAIGELYLSSSKSNFLFAKIGINQYSYDITNDNDVSVDESGTSVVAAAGWEYRFPGGLALNVEYEYQDMGEISVDTVSLGLLLYF